MGPCLAELLVSSPWQGVGGDTAGAGHLAGAPSGQALEVNNGLDAAEWWLARRSLRSGARAPNAVVAFLSEEQQHAPPADHFCQLPALRHLRLRQAAAASFLRDVDDSNKCKEWAERGECESNRDHMLKRCQLSCCRHMGDFNRDCPGWAEGGQCNTNIEYMHETCPKSCNLCERENRLKGWPASD
uniref:ShKT domain-containing protein n=1 Tax=Alexandrium andersonii TaxID=327968 RepID=A0A7S2BIR9_9DINO